MLFTLQQRIRIAFAIERATTGSPWEWPVFADMVLREDAALPVVDGRPKSTFKKWAVFFQ